MLGKKPSTKVAPTQSAIAVLTLKVTDTSCEDDPSESHMLTMMRRYKNAAITAANMATTASV